MSLHAWRCALVLGGLSSGKSAFARALADGAGAVRHLAPRPGESGGLATQIAEAKPDETLLVDDLGGWLTTAGESADAAVTDLVAAVRGCAARLVIVSSEAGLAVPPSSARARAIVERLGRANQAMADACDSVVLVVAGQPTWLKRPVAPAPQSAAAPLVTPAPRQPAAPPAAAVPATTPVIRPGMALPVPDQEATGQATERLRRLDVPGGGLGALAGVVSFAAGTQRSAEPRPWRAVRVLLVHGDHEGGAGAGDSPDEAARRARQATQGEGALGALVADAAAGLQLVPATAARPMETEDANTATEVDEELSHGWRLADEAADYGVDALVIAACGAGADTAAAAITAALTGAEPVGLLGRVHAPGGGFDDPAWMTRCAAVRDALHRIRHRPRAAHDLLAALGGGDLAVVTGVLLGAAARRTPVLLDGPVGVAAALLSRELGGQARQWCLLPDHGGHPTVRHAAEVLGLRPVLDLRLGLGEGATALAALPLLRAALTVAAALPGHPAVPADAGQPVDPDPSAATGG